jgi:PAS domain S-box-containing protein
MSNARRLETVPSPSWDDCRLLVESVTDYAIFMLDTEGHITTWNLGAERIKGYRASEIIGEHFSKFYPPEDVAAGKCDRLLVEAAARGRVEDEGWRVRKDGTRFWASVVITALRQKDGKLRGFAKITRDLTTRREADEEVHRLEERFRLLVESVVDCAIYMLDPEGIVTTWNVGAERIKGYKASEIIGHSFARFFPPEDVSAGKPKRELEIARATGRFEDEGWRVRKNGERFWANVVVTPIRDDHGHHVGFAKVTRDLTARREAEKTQARLTLAESAANRAEEANRLKDEFLATVSHELRTPLTAMIGWARMLRTQPLEPQAASAIEIIERNAKAQAKIIEDLLDISRIVSGKLRLALVDLVPITQDAIEVVRPSATAKDIDIEVEVGEMGLIVGDGERLRQVVWNLLSNAVKFTPQHGKVRLKLERQGSRVMLTVSDTGKGISPDFMPYLFERFKQADQTITRRAGGLGRGRAPGRHNVELHGGTVTATSGGEGHGSTFIVTIPIRAVAPVEARESQQSSPPPPLVDSLHGLQVLVVDDELDARELVATILSEAGAIVTTASSAQEGLACFQRISPSLIVSDLGMPIEDGYSLMRRVRALGDEGRRVPAVALSAFTRNEDRARALAAGFTIHMAKPVDPDDLVRTVTNLVEISRH